MMQSAASAFPIGQYDAIAKASLFSLFPLILVHRVFFFGVLFRTIQDSLFQIGKRRDTTRFDSNFPSHINAESAGVSLFLSPYCSKNPCCFVTNHQGKNSNHHESFHRICRETAFEFGRYSLDHSQSTKSTSRRHSPSRLKDW